ncbi:hypothetical protein [Pedobacter mendelii]|nr:hypothetical protein [Pedobacter mendelii]
MKTLNLQSQSETRRKLKQVETSSILFICYDMQEIACMCCCIH